MTVLIRFVLVGITNTLLTGALFFLLSFVLPTWVAYSVAFACGIVFASYATPRVAFQVRASTVRRTVFATWYLVVYFIGLGVIRLLQASFVASRLEVTIVTVATTATLGFAGARVLFANLPEGEQP